jgi:hypothetical protein
MQTPTNLAIVEDDAFFHVPPSTSVQEDEEETWRGGFRGLDREKRSVLHHCLD